jgi:hypothetical protein
VIHRGPAGEPRVAAEQGVEITVMVAAVASSAMSRRPGCHASAACVPTRANTGTKASTAGGVKLAATILRWLRQSSPSDVSRPRPIVGPRMRFTSRGFA